MEKIKILYFEQGAPVRDMEVENTLKAFQHLVDGYIETFDLFENVTIICNEEGLLRRMEPNCIVSWDRGAFNGQMTIVGSFAVVGVGGEEFRSLTKDEIIKAFRMIQKVPHQHEAEKGTNHENQDNYTPSYRRSQNEEK